MISLLLAVFLAGCGPSEPAAQDAPAAQAQDAEPAKGAHDHDHDAADSAAFKPLEAGAGRVFFEAPEDGATVSSPVQFRFGAEGIQIVPAGTNIPGSGHHHLIINGAPIETGTVVPADETHIHYGTGATEAEVALPAGEHKLTMQLADHAHRSYGPEYAVTITLTVTE